MKYLYTALAIIGFGLTLVAADFWENSRKPGGVASLADYQALWQSRMGMVARGAEAVGLSVETPVRASVGERSNLRAYLPAAPEGFTRRDWQPADNEGLPGFTGAAEEATLMSNFTGIGDTTGMIAKVRNGTLFVYDAGDRLVEMSAIKPKKAMARGMLIPGLADDTNETAFHSMNAMWMSEPWGVVQGVAWSRVLQSGSAGFVPLARWHLTARLGEIHLTFRASDTNEQEVRRFLAAINIDEMNRTLDVPVANVGTSAPSISAAHEVDYAKGLVDVQRTKDSARARTANEDIQTTADRMGKALQAVGLGWETAEESAEASPPAEITINRLSSGGSVKRRSAGCGGTSFCKVGGN